MRSREYQDHICGFCITGHHENCKPKISWYDKEWLCHCKKCHPDISSEVRAKEQEIENDEGTSPSEDIEPSGDTD